MTTHVRFFLSYDITQSSYWYFLWGKDFWGKIRVRWNSSW